MLHPGAKRLEKFVTDLIKIRTDTINLDAGCTNMKNCAAQQKDFGIQQNVLWNTHKIWQIILSICSIANGRADGYNTNRNRKTCNECALRDAVISVNEGEQDYENDFSS